MLISRLIARATKIQSTTGGNSFVIHPALLLLEPIEHNAMNILIRSRQADDFYVVMEKQM